MGLGWHKAKLLCKLHRAGLKLGRVLTIGRLNLFTGPAKVRQLLIDHGGVSPDRVAQLIPDSVEYAEPVLLALGAESVDSLDFSSWEGATIIHNLNEPVPEGLRGQFDLVIDGGTIEHCFDLRNILTSYMQLPRIGGSLIIHTMGNNHMGHGLYQLTPEFFYRVFIPKNGYRMRRLIVHEEFEYAPWYDVPDPAEIGSRIELANPWIGVLLLAHTVREQDLAPLRESPMQSDYAAAWAALDNSQTRQLQPSHPPRTGWTHLIKQMVKETLPSLVMAKHRFNDRHPALARLFNRWKSARQFRRFSFGAQPDRFRYLER